MAKDSKGRTQPGYQQHVFICGHERAATAERPCCSARGSLDVLSKMKRAAEAADMPEVRVQKSGCLDFCENGISCVVYPQGTWYSIKNPEQDIPAIVNYLKTGEVAEDCLMNLQDEG